MIVSKINLDIEIIKLIKNMIFDDVLLINIFSNGVCITQNVNNISNLSIYIDKKYLNIHDINNENSFVTNNIDTLSNLKIEKKNNQFIINNQATVVNDVCNVCKKLINLKFNKIDVNYDQLNIDNKLNFLKGNQFEIIISNKFNGIVLKTKKNMFDLFINILYSP
jgi:hypothetical protein